MAKHERILLTSTWLVALALLAAVPAVTGDVDDPIPGRLIGTSVVLVLAAIIGCLAGWRIAPRLTVLAAVVGAAVCVSDALQRPTLGLAEIAIFGGVAVVAISTR